MSESLVLCEITLFACLRQKGLGGVHEGRPHQREGKYQKGPTHMAWERVRGKSQTSVKCVIFELNLEFLKSQLSDTIYKQRIFKNNKFKRIIYIIHM